MDNIITIGVIGLGNAGAPILNNLNKSNKYKLVAFDIDTKKLNDIPKNIIKAISIKNLAEQCNVVLTCLPKPEHVLEAVGGKDGLLQNASTGMAWIDTSTTNFKQTKELARKASTHGVSMLEATLTGGVHALQNNNMVCLAGGDEGTFKLWKEVLQDAIGEVVVLCGKVGAGAIAKVVSNMLAFTNMVAASECMMIAKKAGLDLENFFDAIRVSAGNSFAWETVVPHIFNQKYESGFTMDLACKDMNLSYLLGQDLKVPLDLHMEVKKKMEKARKQYGDDKGCYVYPRILEDELDQSLSLKGWDNWGYDIKVLDGSIVVQHKNRPKSKHPQYNTVTKD
ncbi:NAD(P)-dependent oxidoreductase [Candidatus Pelagibacter sp.]|nr:NAD(P)-dependent oxidoreductase [Candidatus Pelagibacter sp.]